MKKNIIFRSKKFLIVENLKDKTYVLFADHKNNFDKLQVNNSFTQCLLNAEKSMIKDNEKKITTDLILIPTSLNISIDDNLKGYNFYIHMNLEKEGE